jgi:hypothetical protein
MLLIVSPVERQTPVCALDIRSSPELVPRTAAECESKMLSLLFSHSSRRQVAFYQADRNAVPIAAATLVSSKADFSSIFSTFVSPGAQRRRG